MSDQISPNRKQMKIMVAEVQKLCNACEAAGIPGPMLANHLFDSSRTALAHFGGKRVMADCCRKLAKAYDEAADIEEGKTKH